MTFKENHAFLKNENTEIVSGSEWMNLSREKVLSQSE